MGSTSLGVLQTVRDDRGLAAGEVTADGVAWLAPDAGLLEEDLETAPQTVVDETAVVDAVGGLGEDVEVGEVSSLAGSAERLAVEGSWLDAVWLGSRLVASEGVWVVGVLGDVSTLAGVAGLSSVLDDVGLAVVTAWESGSALTVGEVSLVASGAASSVSADASASEGAGGEGQDDGEGGKCVAHFFVFVFNYEFRNFRFIYLIFGLFNRILFFR